MRILNMTQHQATPEQIRAGLVQPVKDDCERIQRLITFDDIPDMSTLRAVARDFAQLAEEAHEEITNALLL